MSPQLIRDRKLSHPDAPVKQADQIFIAALDAWTNVRRGKEVAFHQKIACLRLKSPQLSLESEGFSLVVGRVRRRDRPGPMSGHIGDSAAHPHRPARWTATPQAGQMNPG